MVSNTVVLAARSCVAARFMVMMPGCWVTTCSPAGITPLLFTVKTRAVRALHPSLTP